MKRAGIMRNWLTYVQLRACLLVGAVVRICLFAHRVVIPAHVVVD